jgi:hypothetical protein
VNEAIFNPLPTVIKVLATIVIIAAEKCAPNTARCAVIIGCMVKADLSASGDGHVDSVFGSAVTITAERDQNGTWSNCVITADSFYLMGVPILGFLSSPGQEEDRIRIDPGW